MKIEGLLEKFRYNKRKLSFGLGLATIVSTISLPGCSKQSDENMNLGEHTTIIEEMTTESEETKEVEITEINDFDPNKCEIEGEHKHLCTWEEMRTYPDRGEILTEIRYWCKDDEVEELKSKHSDSNFKVEKNNVDLNKEINDFDPNKCDIEDEHKHLCTWERTFPFSKDKMIYGESIHWCKDEEIEELRSQYCNSEFKVKEPYSIKIQIEDFDPNNCEIKEKHFHRYTIERIFIDENKNEIPYISEGKIIDKGIIEIANDPTFKLLDECIIYPGQKEIETNKILMKKKCY